jgi:hypothetical protein
VRERFEYGTPNRSTAPLSEPKEHEARVPPWWEAPHIGHALVEREANPLIAARGSGHGRVGLAREPLRLDRVDVMTEGRDVVNQFDGQVLVELDAQATRVG